MKKSNEETFEGKRVHILGVCGTLMAPFAAYLKRAGVHVTGSDQNMYPPMSDVLKSAGVEVYSPFDAANLDRAKPDLVIVGNVIRKTNVEMEAVAAKQVAYMSLPHALETMILPKKHSIVVAGTHGKTTTSSMLAWILEQLNETPSFCIGGVTQNFPESFRITDSKYMVLEGDEYDTAFFDKVPKFTHYKPTDVLLTSVEYDHADIYPDMAAVVSAFEKLAALAPAKGNFIVCAETETPLRIAHQSKSHVVTYGFGSEVDSRASRVETNANGISFKWKCQDETRSVKLNMTGTHNVLNALGCLTLAQVRGWDLDKTVEALETFRGVKRRQELYGQGKGIQLIDDFAHHPTAVRETLAGMRAKYPTSRIVACFEPRSATSRKKIFQQAYAESFDVADLIWIAKPYLPPGQTIPAGQFSTEDLVEDLIARGKRARVLSTTDDGIKTLASELRSGDVVLVMSNGAFDGFLPKLLALISK